MLKRLLLEAWDKWRGSVRDPAPPPDPGGHAALGWACHARGDAAGAERHARNAVALGLDVNSAYLLLAALELPGAYYIDILARIHQLLRPRTYVEIGVFKGKSMVLAGPDTDSIGIDPEPQPAFDLGPRCRILAMTSDAYFATRDLGMQAGIVILATRKKSAA